MRLGFSLGITHPSTLWRPALQKMPPSSLPFSLMLQEAHDTSLSIPKGLKVDLLHFTISVGAALNALMNHPLAPAAAPEPPWPNLGYGDQ